MRTKTYFLKKYSNSHWKFSVIEREPQKTTLSLIYFQTVPMPRHRNNTIVLNRFEVQWDISSNKEKPQDWWKWKKIPQKTVCLHRP